MHPVLLEKLMKENLSAGEQNLEMSMLEAGQSALEQLPSNSIIRSRIALLTASYGGCASFIAAFGEVQESRGIPKTKALIMERYRAAYSRRRAFRDELCLYGMKKQGQM